MSRRGDSTVYSSEHGSICPHCGLPTKRCLCRANPRGSSATPAAGDGIVRVARSSRGRKGKTVTLITGVPLAGPELGELARELKRSCATGGSVKDGVIEIQGDHRDALVEALQARSYTVKKSGG